MNSLSGKVAVVTGASKGIGAAIARALAQGRSFRRCELCDEPGRSRTGGREHQSQRREGHRCPGGYVSKAADIKGS